MYFNNSSFYSEHYDYVQVAKYLMICWINFNATIGLFLCTWLHDAINKIQDGHHS